MKKRSAVGHYSREDTDDSKSVNGQQTRNTKSYSIYPMPRRKGFMGRKDERIDGRWGFIKKNKKNGNENCAMRGRGCYTEDSSPQSATWYRTSCKRENLQKTTER